MKFIMKRNPGTENSYTMERSFTSNSRPSRPTFKIPLQRSKSSTPKASPVMARTRSKSKNSVDSKKTITTKKRKPPGSPEEVLVTPVKTVVKKFERKIRKEAKKRKVGKPALSPVEVGKREIEKLLFSDDSDEDFVPGSIVSYAAHGSAVKQAPKQKISSKAINNV